MPRSSLLVEPAREIPVAPAPTVWVTEPDAVTRVADSGRHRVVLEGILFDRDILARETGAAPAATDADLVLRAWRRWGEGAVSRLKGRFAMSVWDADRETLLCARDALGHHPLFYAATERGLCLSSSVEALAHHPAVRAPVNRTMLAAHLAHQWVDREQTYYAGVRRVPPGHAMLVTRGSRRITRYWNPAPLDGPARRVRDGQMSRFEELLDQAVERCLSLGPAGIYLSGGLDSAAVAAATTDASRRLGLPTPVALSLAFPDPECNEEATQRRLAAALGLPQVMLNLEEAVAPDGFLVSLTRLSSEWPFPTWFVWRPAYQRLAREATAQGCKVILSGGGGDDWLTVDPILAADLLRRLDVTGLVRLTANLHRSYTAGLPRLLAYVLWTNGARPWLRLAAVRAMRAAAPAYLRARRLRRAAASIPRWIAPDRQLRLEVEERSVSGIEDSTPGPNGFYASCGRRMLDHPLTALGAEELFESGRRAGIPEVEPFADPDLVDFLHRTPPDVLNRGGRSKGPIRQMLARRFPHLGFGSQKKVQAIGYLNEIILREGRKAWQQLGGAPALDTLGVLDAGAFAVEVDRILTNRDARDAHRVLDVLVTEAWVRPRT